VDFYTHPIHLLGLANLGVTAGDRFILVTKIVIITLDEEKIIQPLICGWQSVVRGSGNPAILSVL
jgi:hypothetical protein